MNTAAKVAIGCGVVALATGAVTLVGIGYLGYKAKQGIESVSGSLKDNAAKQQEIERFHEQANANTFAPAADGVISEPRLVKFLEVRKQVFEVYQAHRAELDAISGAKKDAGFGDAMKGVAILNDARLARARSLADVGMSESEYQYYIAAVYTSAVASEVSKATGGQKVSEAVHDSMKKAARALEETANATPDPSLPPEAQKAMREAQEQARKQALELERQAEEAAAEGVKGVDVPAANVVLFQKYEDEIKKYAMGGLEVFGL